jgi:hypothetical protein
MTEIDALVNQDGLPPRIVFSAGQASDRGAMEALIDRLPPAQAVIDLVRASGGCAHISTQKDRKIQCPGGAGDAV